ncbi:putative transcription initiation factor TFIID subunit 2, aminopeptidase N-like protein [Helianthus annuus]|nr:putative transcription initiation factor TFIID subunit 2, aminopeptidase N-like protein [Helianthus annuus]
MIAVQCCIFGIRYTELEVAVPENGIVGLHADNLMIECVTVDGEPARFEIFPHYQQMDSDDRWCSVSSANSAADAAGSVYVSCLERELVPNLLIMCSNEATTKPVPEQLEEAVQENGTQTSSESKQVIVVTGSQCIMWQLDCNQSIQMMLELCSLRHNRGFCFWVLGCYNVKLIRIDYWVEKIETGIHIEKDVMHTNNQIRRARCWFPCMDDSLQRCCFDLEFTVATNLVAASTGTLMYQVRKSS